MSTEINIYGQTVRLGELEAGEIVTDVVVISRICAPDDDGVSDTVRVNLSRGSSGIIQTGLIQAAAHNDMSKWSAS